MIVRNNHTVFEPNDIEDHDPGDHDDGLAKATDAWLAALASAYGQPTFDMMMGRYPVGTSPELEAYYARVKADQDRAIAELKKTNAELRAALQASIDRKQQCTETHWFSTDRLGETQQCALRRGHDGDHEDARGRWWRSIVVR